MEKVKRIISMALVLVTILTTFTISASAASTKAFDILSSSKYAKTYTLSSSGITIPYTSKNLTTRGTVTNGASSSSYIDNSSDEIYILDVGCTNGKYWAYVSYPTSSRRVNAYIYLSALSKNNGDHNKSTSSGKFYCSTRENNSTNSSYYVANGDTVYLIATSSSKYQILYPVSGGKWRLAWCSKSDYLKYCTKGNTSSKNNTTVSTKQTNENGVVYTYITMSVDTSSMENWVNSMKNNEKYVCNTKKGVIIEAKVTKTKTVTWKVSKAAVYAGPGIRGTVNVKYKVPAEVKYKVHSHTRNMGFGSSWYYANGCIITVYTCNCGYRKELMAWEIPLPDFSDAQTTQKIIQGLPQIN